MSRDQTSQAVIAGASTALLAVLRARRPDLSWQVGVIEDQDEPESSSSGRSVRDVLEESNTADSGRYSFQYQSKYHPEGGA